MQEFLRDQVEAVDPGVTTHLLASYGRMDDLMHFASCRQVLSEDTTQVLSDSFSNLFGFIRNHPDSFRFAP